MWPRKPAPGSSSDARLLTGDAAAFGRFYERHEDAVLAFFARRTSESELAADLTAETFARALAGRHRFRADLGDPGAWLFGIARRVLAQSLEAGRVLDDTRQRLNMQPLTVDDEALAAIDALDGEPALHALEALPADQAAAIRRRVIDERCYDDLAQELRCWPSVVRQRVSRGLRALRADLGAHRDPAA